LAQHHPALYEHNSEFELPTSLAGVIPNCDGLKLYPTTQ